MAKMNYMEPIFFTPPRNKLDRALYKDSPSPAPAPTSQTVTNTSIPEYARPYVETMLGKAQALCGRTQEGLETLQRVLNATTDSEWKDFEFIVEIEQKIVDILRKLGRMDEAQEIERRLKSVTDVLED